MFNFYLRVLCASVVKLVFPFVSSVSLSSCACMMTALEPGMESHHRQDDPSNENVIG
jgi:hypothetical protein